MSVYPIDEATGLPIVQNHLELRQSDNLMILGKGLSGLEGMQHLQLWHMDVWAVNDMDYPFQTAVIEVHSREKAEERGLMQRKFPVITLVDYGLPHTVQFPKDEMCRAGYPNYYANSICYLLALGIYLGYPNIGLYGVDYLVDMPENFLKQLRQQNDQASYQEKFQHLKNYLRRESLWERPGTEFWIGFAFQKGVKISFSNFSTLMMTGPGERRPYGEWGEEMEAMGKERQNATSRLLADQDAPEFEGVVTVTMAKPKAPEPIPFPVPGVNAIPTVVAS